MSATGLEVFDHTLQQTHVWLNEIGDTMGAPDPQRSYHALRAVLHTLRDTLPPDEAAHLSAQLPMLVRGIYYEGYRPAGKPSTMRSQAAFIDEVTAKIHGTRPMDPIAASRAVFRVMEHYLDPGEVGKVKAALSSDVRALFPSSAKPQ